MRRLAFHVIAAAVLLAASCEATPRRRPTQAPAEALPPVREQPPPPLAEVVARGTILYRVQTGRAEDYVEFLRQVYGPEVILVPQRDTNTILIRIPPRLPGAPQPVAPPSPGPVRR